MKKSSLPTPRRQTTPWAWLIASLVGTSAMAMTPKSDLAPDTQPNGATCSVVKGKVVCKPKDPS